MYFFNTMKNNHKLIIFRVVFFITLPMLLLLMIDGIINRSIASFMYFLAILLVTICYGVLCRRYR